MKEYPNNDGNYCGDVDDGEGELGNVDKTGRGKGGGCQNPPEV